MRRESGMFASKSVAAHIARGVIGAVLLTWAVLLQSSHPAFAVAAGVAALVALGGCPACWTIGLLETVGRRPGSAVCAVKPVIAEPPGRALSARDSACPPRPEDGQVPPRRATSTAG